MEHPPYSPLKQHKVLKAVLDATDARNNNVALFELTIPGMDALEVSFYCRLLQEGHFIVAHSFEDPTGTYTYPMGITKDGKELLRSTDRSFWDHAEKAALLFLKTLPPFADYQPYVDFFRTVYVKYKFEKET